MSVRPDIRALCLALAACSLAPQAMAQTVEAAPLRQIDPWGVGWLGQADGALPVSLWNGASAEILSPLMAALRPEALSPATQAALRRIVLSSGGPAAGGGPAGGAPPGRGGSGGGGGRGGAGRKRVEGAGGGWNP